MNIQEVSMVKYLGVTFDSNLTWKNHVNELCLKLSKIVGIFSKLRYYVTVDILIVMLYFSLIYPFLTYGIQVWGLVYPAYLKPVTAKTRRQNCDFFQPWISFWAIAEVSQTPKILWYNSSWNYFFVFKWYHKLSPFCFVLLFQPSIFNPFL